MGYNKFSDEDKLLEEKYKYKYTCKCGHKVYIYPCSKKNKVLCDWCHNYVFINQHEEAKYRINELIKRRK